MGPVERGLPSVFSLMRERGTPVADGHEIPYELVVRANTISERTYRAILSEWDNERRAERNRAAIDGMADEAAALDDRMSRSGVPRRFVGCSVDSTRNAALSRGAWVYVHGQDVGTVTTRACSILKGWLKAHPMDTARFERSTTILAALGSNGGDEMMARCSSAGLLLLSGLGAESASAWSMARLNDLLERRYGAELPMIVTTRHRPDALAAHLGSRGDTGNARGIVELLRSQSVLVEA